MSLDAIILAGGMGTRLEGAIDKDLPKPLADVDKKPFIFYLFEQLRKAGTKRIIICTGAHQNGIIPKTIGHSYKGIDLIYSLETDPLGTGGAAIKAASLCATSNFFVMNGDSYLNTHLDKFVAWHDKKGFAGSMLVTDGKSDGRYGNIKVGSSGKIKSFSEKIKATDGKVFINAGYYIFNLDLFAGMPKDRKLSLEYDCFPFWVADGLGGFYRRAKFIDIGTPETLKEAQQFFRRKRKQ